MSELNQPRVDQLGKAQGMWQFMRDPRDRNTRAGNAEGSYKPLWDRKDAGQIKGGRTEDLD